MVISRPLKYLFLILSCFCSLGLDAQVMKGTVVDAETSKGLYPVVITNTKVGLSVYTDEDGNFMINAQPGDKLVFYYIGYKTIERVMPPVIGVSNQRVEMHTLGMQLNELIVRPKHYTQYQVDSFERHSTYQRALARQHASAMSPVSFIAERLSKKSKQIFNFQKQYNYWEDQKFIDSRYTPEVVSQLTNLQGDTVAYFMNAYPMPYDYSRAASDLEVKMWIRDNYREWLKHPVYPNIKPIVDSADKK